MNVQIVFSDVARKALDLDLDPAPAALPASFVALAQHAVPGDLVQLPDNQGLFVVSHRVWVVVLGRATLQLVLDVLVQDSH